MFNSLDERADLFDRTMRLMVQEQYQVARRVRGRHPYDAHFFELALIVDLHQQLQLNGDVIAGINLANLVRDSYCCISRLVVPGSLMNGIPISAEIPGILEQRIPTFLTDYRPHLRGSHSDWLFPGRNGRARAAYSARNVGSYDPGGAAADQFIAGG